MADVTYKDISELSQKSSVAGTEKLPAISLISNCYNSLFRNCKKVNHIECMAAVSMSATNCLSNWVNGVSGSGTFIRNSEASWSRGNAGIPTDWVTQSVTP